MFSQLLKPASDIILQIEHSYLSDYQIGIFGSPPFCIAMLISEPRPMRKTTRASDPNTINSTAIGKG